MKPGAGHPQKEIRCPGTVSFKGHEDRNVHRAARSTVNVSLLEAGAMSWFGNSGPGALAVRLRSWDTAAGTCPVPCMEAGVVTGTGTPGPVALGPCVTCSCLPRCSNRSSSSGNLCLTGAEKSALRKRFARVPDTLNAGAVSVSHAATEKWSHVATSPTGPGDGLFPPVKSTELWAGRWKLHRASPLPPEHQAYRPSCQKGSWRGAHVRPPQGAYSAPSHLNSIWQAAL